ncbi:GxxExxY protein [Vibrio splendidus]|uniref:GxxExxY protein n=1 Tax=Vibrio splendidus TaxID=29497 RepID=UPI001C06C687|nr:GxxExxY protein [Vibrio splendidus]MBU2907796.1 hypothetical protein [Vibrio splendidus]MDO6530265.1 GxxExxY protein [Vibrio splendidus]MDO6551320.1 GxxExxY protein [Vibrio splendidus]
MDLAKLIKEKSEVFENTENYLGIECVLNHIDVAEKHLVNGRGGNDYLFNDVIYRANQAFEGALKEAYVVLTGESVGRKTPNDIEKYLENNDLLKERVLDLFSNYRKEWRNKSTHDYKLYFSEQEAFLAIVNIYAFFNILLDQMISKYAKDKEEKEAQAYVEELRSSSDLTLYEQAIVVLKAYCKELPKIQRGKEYRFLEAEVLGSLHGFFSAVAPDINLLVEPIFKIGNGRTLRPDLILEKNHEKVVLELKSPRANPGNFTNAGREQLLTYMRATNINQGILFIASLSESAEVNVCQRQHEKNGIKQYITEVFSNEA